MRRACSLLSVMMLLGACNETTTRERRMADFHQVLPNLTCAELTQELDYQTRIRDGVVERQKQDVTVGDFPATALMLGTNIAMNQSNKSERDDRISELDEKIAFLATTKREKCA